MSRYEASGERPDGARLLHFKDLIRANAPARQALRKLLIGPVVLEAAEDGYTIWGNSCVEELFPSARYWRPQGDWSFMRAG